MNTRMFERVLTDIVLPIQNVLRYDKAAFFGSIAIETTSVCNRKCAYCPSGKYKRAPGKLDTGVINDIFAQLGEIKYNGTIYLHLFNEPLLDKRLPSIIDNARQKCPDSRIFISSNGDFLTTELMKLLIQSRLDLLYVTQYDGKVSDNVREVQEALNGVEKRHLYVRIQNVFENNRGGTLDCMKIEEPLRVPCYRPERMLAINSYGSAVICCNDFLGKEFMGDVRKETLLNIWSSEKFTFFRDRLGKGDRTVSPLCMACNEIINSKTGPLAEYSRTTAYGLYERLGLIM